MNSRNTQLICFIVLLLCAASSASIYFGQKKITDLKIQYELLTDEYNGLNSETKMMELRKQAYIDAFKELTKFKIDSSANVDFYSEAQQAIRRGGANVLSNAPNPPRDGRISMRMTFSGDYYSIIRAFAEIRGLPIVVRVVSVNMASTNNDTSVNSEIQTDVVLETLAYSSK